MFQILKKDKSTKARLGLISTRHGIVKTPTYVIVATHGKIKCLEPKDIPATKTQIVIANTYHLRNQALKIHGILGTEIPIMTDSGGFQVFSLGFGQENKVGKILSDQAKHIGKIRRKNIKITAKGVYFLLDGKKEFLGPELSVQIQSKLGSDIIFAFDECTSPLDDFKYNQKALERTHRWAKESLKYRDPKQLLFGIVQGGRYKRLRQQSAKFIGKLPFDGFGIGGSFGKDEMVKTLQWVIPYLPEEKPRHLLGIGRIEDVFNAVENGVDLFDCVIPTREARHGRIWTHAGSYDIRKGIYAKDKKSLEPKCKCLACLPAARLPARQGKAGKSTSKAKLRELFKSDKPTAQRLATIHNVYFFNTLLEEIRAALSSGRYQEFKKKFFTNFN